jgi:hypothetical protein
MPVQEHIHDIIKQKVPQWLHRDFLDLLVHGKLSPQLDAEIQLEHKALLEATARGLAGDDVPPVPTPIGDAIEEITSLVDNSLSSLLELLNEQHEEEYRNRIKL